MPGVMELGKEELQEVDGGGILGRTLGTLVGSLLYKYKLPGTITIKMGTICTVLYVNPKL